MADLIHVVVDSELPLHEVLKKIGYDEALTGELAFKDWVKTGKGDTDLIRMMVGGGFLKSEADLEEALFVTNGELFEEKLNRRPKG